MFRRSPCLQLRQIPSQIWQKRIAHHEKCQGTLIKISLGAMPKGPAIYAQAHLAAFPSPGPAWAPWGDQRQVAATSLSWRNRQQCS